MQTNVGHERKIPLPVPHAHRLFARFPAFPAPCSSSLDFRLSRPARDHAYRARWFSSRIDDKAGQRWGPSTRSVFFRGDIGGETQGIQRFQLVEGVE